MFLDVQSCSFDYLTLLNEHFALVFKEIYFMKKCQKMSGLGWVCL